MCLRPAHGLFRAPLPGLRPRGCGSEAGTRAAPHEGHDLVSRSSHDRARSGSLWSRRPSRFVRPSPPGEHASFSHGASPVSVAHPCTGFRRVVGDGNRSRTGRPPDGAGSGRQPPAIDRSPGPGRNGQVSRSRLKRRRRPCGGRYAPSNGPAKGFADSGTDCRQVTANEFFTIGNSRKSPIGVWGKSHTVLLQRPVGRRSGGRGAR